MGRGVGAAAVMGQVRAAVRASAQWGLSPAKLMESVDAVVRDISAGGAGLIVSGTFHNEAFVDLHMEGFGRVSARIARKFVQGIGVEFNLNEKERA